MVWFTVTLLYLSYRSTKYPENKLWQPAIKISFLIYKLNMKLCSLFTSEETKAELDTLGTLSTMACFMYLSMACSMVVCGKRQGKVNKQHFCRQYFLSCMRWKDRRDGEKGKNGRSAYICNPAEGSDGRSSVHILLPCHVFGQAAKYHTKKN